MTSILVDTHTIIWYLQQSDQLSLKAKARLDQTTVQGKFIYISAISLVEIIYLVEKYRISNTALEKINNALSDPEFALSLIPLDLLISKTLTQIPRETVPDMPDRIIAATALACKLPLITRDSKIQALKNIQIIW
ncbi:UNVERIFIED_CONTAM: twitching motility protein PilT [Euhalothece sp. KZN 001]